MSNENIDQDALATEEMLKMFEGMAPDEAQADATDTLMMEDDIEALLAAAEAELLDGESLPEFTGSDELTNELDTTEGISEETAAELVTNEDDNTGEPIQSLDDTEDTVDEAAEFQETSKDESTIEQLDETELEAFAQTPESNDATPVNTSESQTTSEPIAEHLQAVVSNAIQALQDWLSLREESETKGPEQSIAQLDVLLQTVTTQQQQLAEQLANNQQQHINALCEQLGVTPVTAESLGWQDNEWQQKAAEVANKTKDIQRMNDQIRKDLALL